MWDRWDFINIYLIINPYSAGTYTGGFRGGWSLQDWKQIVDWEIYFGDWEVEQEPTFMEIGSSVVVGYFEM